VIEAEQLSDIWEANIVRLMLIARSIAGRDNGLAEDAVQEAFIALAQQDMLPDEPLAWLVRVTRNQLLQWHRGKQRRNKREEIAGERAWFSTTVSSIQQQLDAQEVTLALQSLPSPEREIIVMHLWGEMTFESIAKVVGGSRASVHRAFQRGLTTLKTQFNSVRTYHE
jgi:RNA polymerase sigma factor (sigma-70 family)